MFVPALLVFLAYCALIITGIYSWKKAEEQKAQRAIVPRPPAFFSVLIPFRNEAQNLPGLVENLRNQSLPSESWECILIDDHSTDQGLAFLADAGLPTNFRIISNRGEGKKQAIAEGLKAAKGEYLVQADADCFYGRHWLETICTRIAGSGLLMVTGPVYIPGSETHTLLDYFQAFEGIALMGMTQAGIYSGGWHLANGANLAAHRSVYDYMRASDPENPFASGDDLFLMQAAVKMDKSRVGFLFEPSALVGTRPLKNIHSFIQQRLRWGSKNHALEDWKIKLALFIPILCAMTMVGMLAYSLWSGQAWVFTVSFWAGKFLIDYLYFKALSPFFRLRISPFSFLTCALVYPFYLLIIVLLSIFKRKYEWKGRLGG
ncbi:MAG TPA: glycosyltransferase [Saprospiraceae bacterium]|nr:glycosyltransferase [Saprospiraceae bacterium]